MRRASLVVALVLVACSPEQFDPTTTTPPAATTIVTTTTIATTTSTSTTTTTLGSTTTTEAVAGNWADQPLITTGFGALGWWDGSSWIRVDDVGALPVVGGEDYQIATLNIEEVTTGGPQVQICEPAQLIGVELEDDEILGEWPGPYGIAISAGWPLKPHLVEEVPDDGTYGGFASLLLAERGLEVDEPQIKQLIRTDLEGDGVNEVLVVAEEVEENLFPNSGDYSIAFLRKVVEGEVQTAILGDTVVGDDETFPASFSIGAVADLNGDGKMEIVLNSAYYEGLGVEVWEYVDDDLGPTPQLSMVCGA